MENVVTFFSKKPRPVTVNGETVAADDIDATAAEFAQSRQPREAAARALVVRTLLRQRAAVLQVEASDEESAIEKLLEREISLPAVDDEEVRRFYDGNPEKFRSGDLFQVRHILFDSTAKALRQEAIKRAESALLLVKEHPESFERLAREQSACTSREVGGDLGQLSPGSVVAEFWAALIAFGKPGLLPTLVETRFGHHIVKIDRCALGEILPFDVARGKIREYLTGRREQLAYQEYVAGLIASAEIAGVDLSDQKPQPAGPGLALE